jgi:hypothetical protein
MFLSKPPKDRSSSVESKERGRRAGGVSGLCIPMTGDSRGCSDRTPWSCGIRPHLTVHATGSHLPAFGQQPSRFLCCRHTGLACCVLPTSGDAVRASAVRADTVSPVTPAACAPNAEWRWRERRSPGLGDYVWELNDRARFRAFCAMGFQPMIGGDGENRLVRFGKTKFRQLDNLLTLPPRKCPAPASWFSHISPGARPEGPPTTAWKAVPLKSNGD